MSSGTGQLVNHLLDCLLAPQPLVGSCQVVVSQTARAQSGEQLVPGTIPNRQWGQQLQGDQRRCKANCTVEATYIFQK